jgi:hypothetical protein
MLMHYGSDEDAIKLNFVKNRERKSGNNAFSENHRKGSIFSLANLPSANLPLALASGSQSKQKSALAEWFG